MPTGRNKQEQKMFDALESWMNHTVGVLLKRDMAFFLSIRFCLTPTQARAIRDRFLKMRKQEAKENP